MHPVLPPCVVDGYDKIPIIIMVDIHASASAYLDKVAGGPESFSVDARLVRKTKSFGQNISLALALPPGD